MNTVIVSNFPEDATETQLQDLFWEYGEVRAVRFGTRRKYALVAFDDPKGAELAVWGGGKKMSGQKLKVKMAKWDV
jgi:RNA recognition motif-containing protein